MAYKTTTTRGNFERPESLGGVSPGLRRFVKTAETVSNGENLPFTQIIRFLAWNAPLMLIFWNVPVIGRIHSVLTLLLGVSYALRDERPARASFVIAYIASCEILWRGTEASLLSEYGKYASILLSILLILRFRLLGKNLLWPLLFLILLLPGVLIAPFDRQAISYQLAGPVAIAFLSMAFGGITFTRKEIQQLLLATIAPAIAMGMFVIFMLLTNDVTFSGRGEDEAITGGIGANQVSSALALGATAAFFYIFLSGKDRRVRYTMIASSLGLLTLAVLTFSRGGVWTALGAAGLGSVFMIRDRRLFFRILGILVLLGLLGYFVLFPIVNRITGGTVVTRFSSLDTTDRDVLFQIDYRVFLDNPVLGVGVGQSPKYHFSAFGYPKPTHTEYSRLLAEHGFFGIAVMVLWALVFFARVLSRQDPLWKGISVGFTAWALMFMVHSATRMVAPSFAFGLAAASLLPDEEQPQDD